MNQLIENLEKLSSNMEWVAHKMEDDPNGALVVMLLKMKLDGIIKESYAKKTD